MVKVSIIGRMERSMTEHGSKEDSMVKGNLLIQKERVNLVTGKMVKEKNGLSELSLILIMLINKHLN